MSEQLHEPGEDGDVVDQTEADLTAGPTSVRADDAGPVDAEGPNPGHPASATTAGSPGEASSRDGVGPAGPESTTTGTGGGTGADPGTGDVPPTAPG